MDRAAYCEMLADFSRQTFYDTFASANSAANMDRFMQTQFTRESLIDEYRNPATTSIMVFEGDELYGYSTLKTSRPKD